MKLKRYGVDLHIHTALSPCASNEMTPQNVVRMAKMDGLQIIAVTDHNSIANVGAVVRVGKEQGLAVIPGMEVQTREEIHLLALFPSLGDAEDWQAVLHPTLPEHLNNERVFGAQIICDWKDRELDRYDRLLSLSSRLSLEECVSGIHLNNGMVIPAHVTRRSFGLIGQLGFIPENLNIEAVEISPACQEERLKDLKVNHPVVCSSDAHNLRQLVTPRRTYLYAYAPTFSELLLGLRGEGGRKVVIEAGYQGD